MQLNREQLLTAYRTMRTIRDFEERVHVEFSAGGIPGFVHLYAGEEASAVGVCSHLDERDKIASTHRGHGHCLAKGCDVNGMMAEIFGRADGLCGGKGGSMHIADLSRGMMGANGIVGGGPPLICGAALTAKTLKTGGVAVAFIGDGASNQGTTMESYNLAKAWMLPAIFVVEDNGYAESTGSGWSVSGTQLDRAKALASRPHRWTGMISSPCWKPRARWWSARATAAARRCCMSSWTASSVISRAMPAPIAGPARSMHCAVTRTACSISASG